MIFNTKSSKKNKKRLIMVLITSLGYFAVRNQIFYFEFEDLKRVTTD